MNKISIIIIAYNEEKYIAGILNALINQTVKNFEVIVVDSNSIDKTEQVTKAFACHFEEFRYVRLDAARGPAYSRNRGAEVAKYERLLFFDADTSVKSNFIERINNQIKKRNLDTATCPIRILEGGWSADLSALFLNSFMYFLKPVYSSGYGACFISTREVHNLVGGFDETIGLCEDCLYIKKARREHHLKHGILTPYFYTSDRRAKAEGGILFILKFAKLHLYRMISGKEIQKEEIVYNYGNFNN
ncbi:glycosyltransferase [Marinilabilia sp.]|uniref:glycosyltransferase family 2 protein n=1 Tax=Marinilabilia sp. TaxID=2021252 RepID=UPI0025C28CAA|nr:glycosyltransferase [Marinilabilia sp.]